jgi:hypothetical protein
MGAQTMKQNKDFLHLLKERTEQKEEVKRTWSRGKYGIAGQTVYDKLVRESTMQEMIDSSPIASEIMNALRQDLNELMQQYMYQPNDRNTRDALAISVQSQLDHLVRDGHMSGATVDDVQVGEDGVATVNVSYRPPVNFIEVSINPTE